MSKVSISGPTDVYIYQSPHQKIFIFGDNHDGHEEGCETNSYDINTFFNMWMQYNKDNNIKTKILLESEIILACGGYKIKLSKYLVKLI